MSVSGRTRLQLRTRVRELADCMPDANARHPSATLNMWIDESIQALRSMVTAKGDLLYVETAAVSTGVGPSSGKAYGVIAWPSGAVRIHAIDLMPAGSLLPVSLAPVSFAERNAFGGSSVVTGQPHSFAVFNVGKESTTSITPGSIALLPAPDRVYATTIYYLGMWVDLSNDTHIFHGYDGWDDWVAYDVVIKCAIKDNDMAQTATLALQMQAKAEERVLASSVSTQRVGPSYGRDTARELRQRRRGPFWQ